MNTPTIDGDIISIQGRALKLLGQGFEQSQVANALGVSASLISQYMSDEQFSSQVAALRYEVLAEASTLDGKYSSAESKLIDALLEKIESGFVTRTSDLLGALRVVNSAVRRGVNKPTGAGEVGQGKIVQVVLPVTIANTFTIDSSGQVISAGSQDLTTIQASALKGLQAKHNTARISVHTSKEVPHELHTAGSNGNA